jgi:hypothetical protein
MTEDVKQEKFRRLAESRTEKLLKSFGTLGNLSNTYTYSYQRSEIDDIFAALQEELDATRTKFDTGLEKLEQRRADSRQKPPFARRSSGFRLAS